MTQFQIRQKRADVILWGQGSHPVRGRRPGSCDKELNMNKLNHRLISLIAALVLAFGGSSTSPVLAASNTYYVSTTGSDTNSGSLTAPFKTFAKAVSIMQAGDTLQVMPGTY